jgi:putative addiction module component (TIGR02574 family)
MSPTLKALGIDRLSVEDRLALAEAIWDSVVQEADQAPLTEAQRHELERRLADSIAHPEAVTPWEVVKARALARALARARRSSYATKRWPSSMRPSTPTRASGQA